MTQPLPLPTHARPRPGARRLVIHIGDHKTGTTSIQNAFAAGRVALEGQSLLYPANLAHNYLRAHVNAFAKGQEMDTQKADMPGLADLAGIIREAAADVTVISAEEFEGLDPKILRRVLETRFDGLAEDLRIVAYVRPHAARVVSTYAEEIKIGEFQGTLEQYHAHTKLRRRFIYAPRFRAWRKVFGDAFVLRPMIRDQLSDGSVLHDFIRSALGEVPFTVTESRNDNESLCLEDLVLLRLVQSMLADRKWGVRHAFGWELAHQLGQLPRPAGKTRLGMHRALAEKVARAYRKDARAMDAEFFGGAPLLEAELDRSLETALPDPQSLEPSDHFSPDEIRNLKIAAGLIVARLHDTKGNWAMYFRDQRIKALDAPA